MMLSDRHAHPARGPARAAPSGRGLSVRGGIPLRGPGGGSRRRRGTRLAARARGLRLGAVGGAGVARASQAGLRRVARRVGELVGAAGGVLLFLVAAVAWLVRPLAAQLPDAEAAFQRGDYRAARAAYERVLAADSTNVRALYRLAILDSWDGKLGRALDRFARLRRLEPRDGDIMVATERALAPQDRTVLELERELRAAVRPQVRTTVDGAGDSDGNTFVAQEAYYEASLGTAVRGTLRAGWRHASLGTAAAASYGAGGQVSAPLGAKAAVQAGLGVRRLHPDGGAGTTPLTAALGLRLRPGRYVAGGIGYSHAP